MNINHLTHRHRGGVLISFLLNFVFVILFCIFFIDLALRTFSINMVDNISSQSSIHIKNLPKPATNIQNIDSYYRDALEAKLNQPKAKVFFYPNNRITIQQFICAQNYTDLNIKLKNRNNAPYSSGSASCKYIFFSLAFTAQPIIAKFMDSFIQQAWDFNINTGELFVKEYEI